jgi:hypothetical protein
MTLVSKLWKTITDGQRSAWSDWATAHPVSDWTGSPKRLTGMNWFTRCNILLTKLGLTRVLTAPTISAPNPPTGLTLSFASNAIRATWTAPSSNAQVIMFDSTPNLSAGREGKLQMAAFASYCSSAVATPFTIVGSVTTGRYTVFAKVVDSTNGLPSPYVSAFIDVA